MARSSKSAGSASKPQAGSKSSKMSGRSSAAQGERTPAGHGTSGKRTATAGSEKKPSPAKSR